MNKKQPEALDLAFWLEAVGGGPSAKRCAALLREQHARITELESQLAQRFDAADMATAAAQGFRDGVVYAELPDAPLPVFSKGPWTFKETGQSFSGAELDEAAFVAYRDRASHGKAPAQLAQRFDAADVATASAQGFRDGVASVSAGWQSIETAPKDCQAILVTDGRDCYCVEWSEEFDWWTVDDNKLGPFRLRGSAPTHWMPLPAAPGSADGESNELC